MTRTVGDAALMMNVITKPDLRDWYALPYAGTDYLKGLEGGVKGWKIAFSPTMGGHPVDPEIAKLVASAAQVFRDLGATVEEVDPDIGAAVGPTFVNHWFPGAANALRPYSAEQRKVMDPGLREVAEAGARLSLMDYLASVKEREQLGVRMNMFHKTWNLLLTPTLPLPAFAAGIECPVMADGSRWTDWTPFSYPFNLTRQPAATVPCGLTSARLPAGLQIVGPLLWRRGGAAGRARLREGPSLPDAGGLIQGRRVSVGLILRSATPSLPSPLSSWAFGPQGEGNSESAASSSPPP